MTLVLVFLDLDFPGKSGNVRQIVKASPSTAETMMAALTSNQERVETTIATTPEPIICRQPCTSNGICDSKSGECKCWLLFQFCIIITYQLSRKCIILLN